MEGVFYVLLVFSLLPLLDNYSGRSSIVKVFAKGA